MAAIYLLTCDSAKNYIGVSTSPERRVQAHLSGNGSRLVKEALNLGASFNSFILYEHEDVFELYKLEQSLIDKYKGLYPAGYNIDEGGRQGGVSSRAGSLNTQAILTEELVLEIRELYAADSRNTQSRLASNYGVSRETISALVRGKSWLEVGGPIIYKRNEDKQYAPELISQISDLYLREGLSPKEIANKLDLIYPTVYKYCKQLAPVIRKRSVVSDEHITKILTLKSQGVSFRQIATLMPFTDTTVAKYYRKYKDDPAYS